MYLIKCVLLILMVVACPSMQAEGFFSRAAVAIKRWFNPVLAKADDAAQAALVNISSKKNAAVAEIKSFEAKVPDLIAPYTREIQEVTQLQGKIDPVLARNQRMLLEKAVQQKKGLYLLQQLKMEASAERDYLQAMDDQIRKLDSASEIKTKYADSARVDKIRALNEKIAGLTEQVNMDIQAVSALDAQLNVGRAKIKQAPSYNAVVAELKVQQAPKQVEEVATVIKENSVQSVSLAKPAKQPGLIKTKLPLDERVQTAYQEFIDRMKVAKFDAETKLRKLKFYLESLLPKGTHLSEQKAQTLVKKLSTSSLDEQIQKLDEKIKQAGKKADATDISNLKVAQRLSSENKAKFSNGVRATVAESNAQSSLLLNEIQELRALVQGAERGDKRAELELKKLERAMQLAQSFESQAQGLAAIDTKIRALKQDSVSYLSDLRIQEKQALEQAKRIDQVKAKLQKALDEIDGLRAQRNQGR